jgi:LmbE family N-acetylglucosaminyl deacetylase
MNPGMAAALLPPLALLAIVVATVLRRPRILSGEAKPALILAAHPDDCVILAGAYAIFARAAGKRVQVAYLTCGAASATLPRAVIRRQEALAVWRGLGMSREDISFFDLPEHAVSAVSSWTDADRARARAWICELLRQLPDGALVFLPAAGEAHVDHRGLRRIALEAWAASGLGQLSFLEGPEYNDYLSVLQSPGKVLAFLVTGIPGLSRLVRGRRPCWTGFAQGGPSWTLPPSEERLEQRRDLLRGFVSEDGGLLVRLFGDFERYRPVPSPEAGLSADPPRGYLSLGGRRRGVSAILSLIVMGELASLLAAMAARFVTLAVGSGMLGRAAIAGAAACAVALGLRRRVMLDSRVLYLALAIGAVLPFLDRR